MLEEDWLSVELREWIASTRSTFHRLLSLSIFFNVQKLSHPWLRGSQRPDNKTLSTFPSLFHFSFLNNIFGIFLLSHVVDGEPAVERFYWHYLLNSFSYSLFYVYRILSLFTYSLHIFTLISHSISSCLKEFYNYKNPGSVFNKC